MPVSCLSHYNRLFHNVKTGALANELVPYSCDKSPNATLVDGRINYFIETLAREFERTKENRGQYFCLAIICILWYVKQTWCWSQEKRYLCQFLHLITLDYVRLTSAGFWTHLAIIVFILIRTGRRSFEPLNTVTLNCFQIARRFSLESPFSFSFKISFWFPMESK